MGRTPVPLVIAVEPGWETREEIMALAAKGHTIVPLPVSPGYDLILSPAAHWWDEPLWEKPAFLEVALKRARASKKGKGK